MRAAWLRAAPPPTTARALLLALAGGWCVSALLGLAGRLFVRLRQRRLAAHTRPLRYFVLWKPYMVLCSMAGDRAKAASKGRAERETLRDLELPSEVHHVGRLDRDSEGLLLLTDDGRFTNEVLTQGHPKRYWALVTGSPGDEQIEAMARGGMTIRGRTTQPASVRRLSRAEMTPLPPNRDSDPQESRCTWLEVILQEGMNRQVRKLTKHAGHTTIRLVRAGVGRLRLEDLPDLQPGEVRPIERADVL